MNINVVKFEIPGMDDKAKEMYIYLYVDDEGCRFVDILSSSPDEIAVISRLIAFLMMKKKGEN